MCDVALKCQRNLCLGEKQHSFLCFKAMLWKLIYMYMYTTNAQDECMERFVRGKNVFVYLQTQKRAYVIPVSLSLLFDSK